MHSTHSNHDTSSRPARRLVTTVAGALALATLAACASRPIPPGLGVPWGATVKSIVANPQQAEGKLVTVSGEVNRIFGPRWFSIGGEGFDGGEELLVVGTSRIPALINSLADSGKIANDLVQVTGRVRFFDRVALEKEVGEDLGGDWWRPYEQKPVVVMTDLAVTSRADVVPVVALPVTVSVPATMGVSAVPITDGLMIISTPNRAALVGRSVALFDVKVQTVVGKTTFWVGPNPNQQMFVVADPNMANLDQLRVGQTMSVAGVIEAMPSDLSSVRTLWSLSSANESTMAREVVYLRATAMYMHSMATQGAASDSRMKVQKDGR